MRSVVPALVIAAAAFAAGVLWTRTAPPAAAAPVTGAALPDDQTIAALRKDNQLLRAELAVLANEVALLRTSLQDRPVAPVPPAASQAQADFPETPANKPAKDALERYRAATGSPKPADPAELVPYFTDPQQAAAFLKNREAAVAKPERQQLKAELKTELKQRLKASSDNPPAP
jgi:fructose-specific component phosphotransferase system IIB-like protein